VRVAGRGSGVDGYMRLGCNAVAGSFTLNLPAMTVLLDTNRWNPSYKNDPSVYQGTGTVPNVCACGQVRRNQGGSFSAVITLN